MFARAFLQILKYHRTYIVFVASRQFEIDLVKTLRNLELPPEVARGIEETGGLPQIAKTLSSTRELAKKARYHKALSDIIRLRLLYALSMTEMCPCILKEIAGTSDSKLSYHLRILESEGMIKAKRVKNWRIYSITAKGRDSLTANRE